MSAIESGVRSYSRAWPVVFDRALGSWLHAEDGTPYLDFFAGAGALNYGHNNPVLKDALLDYLASDRVVHALDMFTVVRQEMLETLDTVLLRPRDLPHRVVFPGPAGANAVEGALKLARKVTGRETVVHFRNGFHGMTLGALSVAGTASHRASAGVPVSHTVELPYDDPTELARIEELRPAAVIVESVQGEGGIDAAAPDWLRALAEHTRRAGALLILDDIQVGCGRTGAFFSVEDAGVVPDLICLSKSISGYGLPMALLLIRPELDVWRAGEHNGTFRGFNPAFVTCTAALTEYWTHDKFEISVREKGERMGDALTRIAEDWPDESLAVRGRGMIRGLRFAGGELASRVARAAFETGLLVETCGPGGAVVKLLPPLTISDAELDEGLSRFATAVASVEGQSQ
jgi:diaminobutyrate-2-oxoglutarate transaminase